MRTNIIFNDVIDLFQLISRFIDKVSEITFKHIQTHPTSTFQNNEKTKPSICVTLYF